jgi:hypothetical protein
MNASDLQNIRERTDSKLRYAKVYLDMLLCLETIAGTDADRAHQDSFTYHLLGAKDAFIIELKHYYKADLHGKNLTLGNLLRELQNIGKESPELAELHLLQQDKNSWLSQAKDIRDHSTHGFYVSRTYNIGGDNDEKVFLKNPNTGKLIEKHFVEVFSEWLGLMDELLNRLRVKALENNGL